MGPNEFAAVLLTSVPEADVALARELLPKAKIETEPLSPAVTRRHPYVTVLSVMVHDPVSSEMLSRFNQLKAVVTRSDRYDHLPLPWMRARKIAALNLGEYATTGVAHLAVGFIIALARRVPEGVQETAKGGWDRSRLQGRSLEDVTVGVLGTGRIGSAVVRLLSGMGVKTLGHDIAPDATLGAVAGFRYAGSFEAMLQGSDIVTVHVPLKEDTRGMIDAKALALLPEGACLVNTARGPIVDQAAVEAALKAGRLGGYAADVMPGEPAPPDLERFRGLPNVVITPHLAAWDQRTIRARYEYTARAVKAVLENDTATLAKHRVG